LEKRIRERARRDKQLEKEQRRQKRVNERQSDVKPRKDADLEHMRPGPQPGQIINID
jgi:hypothetical protein